MVNAQEWLDANYSKENRSKITEIYINEQLEETLDLTDFNNLEKIFISHLVDKSKLEIVNKKKETANPARRRNKLESLNISDKELEGSLDLTSFTNLKKLYCQDNKLTSLKLNNLTKLETIFCFNNRLTKLETNGLNNLEWLNSKINNLTDLNSLLSNLNSIKLKQLDLRNNKFSESDLSPLSKFTNLECLEITNNFSQQGGKNNFSRSLKSLQFSTNLKSLHVVDSASDKFIYCSSNPKDGSVISQIEKLTKFNQEWLDNNYPLEQRKYVEEIHLNEPYLAGELDLGDFTRQEGIKVFIALEVEASKLVLKNLPASAEIIETIQAQKYIDQQYPTPQAKANCQVLNIGVKSEYDPKGIAGKCLAGSLSLKGFTNLKTFGCRGQNITNLDLTGGVNLEVLVCENNQLTSLDISNCQQLKKLGCGTNKLTNLNLTNLEQLENLCCHENQLMKLNLSQNKQLTELCCYDSQLNQLILPTKLPNLEKLVCRDNLLTHLDFAALNGEKLIDLSLTNNNFPTQDLTSLTKFINLKQLDLGNTSWTKINDNIYNHWTGSLQPLQNMQQLQRLVINNTDLDSGSEYLPVSIEEILCSRLQRPTSKVKLIAKELERDKDFILTNSVGQVYLKRKLNPELLNQIKDFDHKHLTSEQETLLKRLIFSGNWRGNYKSNGLCANCQQLNSEVKWCQPCEVPRLKADFAYWTSGNPEIDKFIQKCQLEATNSRQALKWIPYEEFINIEHLADGGFGKVYKANWTEFIEIDELVALKSLTNSQNINSEFLSEIINTKLADGNASNFVVPCYGISREPDTGNYVMVMQYMSEGNLRESLSKNYQQLKFADKLSRLRDITQSLVSIHQADLMHQDFHPGNVLNTLYNNRIFSYISDLGLSRPISEVKQDKLYGVLPYAAPEVLRGKPYTPASDIYSFGIVAYEFLANAYPYPELDDLGLRVCRGLRPGIDELKLPPLLKSLIKRCWDADPKQRPNASELFAILNDWFDDGEIIRPSIKKDTEFIQQYQALLPEIDSLPTKPLFNHSPDKYTSKLLDTKQIAQLFQESKEKEALKEELKKMEKEIDQPLTGEPKELVSEFIQAHKKRLKGDKEARKKIKELNGKLEEKLTKENIEKIIEYCERFIDLEQQLEEEKLETNIEIPTNQ